MRPRSTNTTPSRLYRGLKERYKPELVGREHEGPPTGTDFTDESLVALGYARGRHGVLLVIDVPDTSNRVTEELWGIDDSGPKRFMLWGRFDDLIVAEIPAKELRKHTRAKGVRAADDECKTVVLTKAIGEWLAFNAQE